MQLTSKRTSPDTLCTLVQVQKLGTLKKHPDKPKGKWDELAKQVTNVYLAQKHPILEGCMNFQKGELKKGGAKMHFNAADSSKNNDGSHQFSQRLLYRFRNMLLSWKDQ